MFTYIFNKENIMPTPLRLIKVKIQSQIIDTFTSSSTLNHAITQCA